MNKATSKGNYVGFNLLEALTELDMFMVSMNMTMRTKLCRKDTSVKYVIFNMNRKIVEGHRVY